MTGRLGCACHDEGILWAACALSMCSCSHSAAAPRPFLMAASKGSTIFPCRLPLNLYGAFWPASAHAMKHRFECRAAACAGPRLVHLALGATLPQPLRERTRGCTAKQLTRGCACMCGWVGECVCVRAGCSLFLSYLGWGRCRETHQQMALTLGIIGLALAMPFARAAEILKKYSL